MFSPQASLKSAGFGGARYAPPMFRPLWLVLAMTSAPETTDPDLQRRQRMVREQIERRGIRDQRVLDALRQVPRHELVPKSERARAYGDHPLPIGYQQTISQPYIVASMTELIDPKPTDRVLEIGTGSGYQAAVLSLLVKEVFTIEIVEPLAKRAEYDLKRLGYKNVTVIHGDGYLGLPKKAPFDAIVVTAAPEIIPQPLIDQLEVGGRMVIPVGDRDQELKLIEKTKKGLVTKKVYDVRFVPMTGEVEKRKKHE